MASCRSFLPPSFLRPRCPMREKKLGAHARSGDSGLGTDSTGLSKRKGAKLRESFCPAAASHSRPRQAGA